MKMGARTPNCQTFSLFWGVSRFFMIFFPQPLVDGFSKLWLRGKGNLRVETLIPAGSMMGFTPGPCSVPTFGLWEGVVFLFDQGPVQN